jgi:hypothetical protein
MRRGLCKERNRYGEKRKGESEGKEIGNEEKRKDRR